MSDKKIACAQFTVTVCDDGSTYFMADFGANEKTVAFVRGVVELVQGLWPESEIQSSVENADQS